MKKLQQKLSSGTVTKHAKTAGLVTILGPTAGGKSSLGLRVAEHCNGSIVCADSRTIYRGMDIGTAKPSQAERDRITHYLLDVCNPDQRFSAKDFVDQAKQSLEDISLHDKQALMVGGSGMYIDALLFNYQFRKQNQESSESDLANYSLEQLWELTYKTYGEYPAESDRQNRRRVEDFVRRGPALTSDRERVSVPGQVVGLFPGPDVLRGTIQRRTTAMLEAGMIEEVEQLLKRYDGMTPGLRSTGYRQAVDYINGNILRSELAPAINHATWQLARKQLTWFKRNLAIEWFEDSNQAFDYIATYLEP